MSFLNVVCPKCHQLSKIEQHELPLDGAETVCTVCQQTYIFSAAQVQVPWAEPVTDSSADKDFPLADAPERTVAFEFQGTGREYFTIWMTNVQRQMFTLGIYTPWAKVRRRKYFYSNTILDGDEFQYLADPVAILKGWLLAGLFFALYSLFSDVHPAVGFLIMLAFFAIYPWLLVRARMFNCANSTYRNIRFRFARNYSGAYKEYLLMPMLVIATLGFLAPYIYYRQRRFLVENTYFGATPFNFNGNMDDYYRAFAHSLIMWFLTLLLLSAVKIPLTAALGHETEIVGIRNLVAIACGFFFISVYLPTVLDNITWSATSIADHRLSLSLSVAEITWIRFTNLVVTICSIGLLAPWCAIRLARYRLGRLTMTGAGGLDHIVAGSDTPVGAAGEEVADLFDFDLGL